MFRPLRRGRQQLSAEECTSILENATAGTLAVVGDEGWPYAVPLSYVYHEGAIYFHCATTGHKLDAICKEPRVSFCVVAQDEVQPEAYTTFYRSVIVFGTAEILEDPGDVRAAIDALATKYHPTDSPDHRAAAITCELPALRMVKITPAHITGKAAVELLRAKSL